MPIIQAHPNAATHFWIQGIGNDLSSENVLEGTLGTGPLGPGWVLHLY